MEVLVCFHIFFVWGHGGQTRDFLTMEWARVLLVVPLAKGFLRFPNGQLWEKRVSGPLASWLSYAGLGSNRRAQRV